jgi:NAD(P)-dependent dehydrogenase (short-subunit alcohol dehydrogenase family)
MQAGVIDMAPSLEFDVQAVQRMMDVNFFGVLRVYQAFAPLMLRTANHPDVVNKMNKERAVIVNIGSTAGVGGPWQGAYGASKVRLPCSIPSAHLGWRMSLETVC